MKQAQQLLDDLHNTKRASCLSEWEGWINDVTEYLEQEARAERSYGEVDPTIQNQMDLPLEPPPKRGDIRFELLED